MALKAFSKTFLFFYRFLLRRLKISRRSGSHAKPCNCETLEKLTAETLVVDVEGGLLRSSSTFPYFMLVALEAGGFIRGLILLLFCPLLCFLNQEAGLRVMVMVSFCGLRAKGFRVGRAVLPRFFLEDVGLEGFEVLRTGCRRVVCVSCMPRVMVEGFLKEYLEVEVVIAREMKVLAGFYTGFMEEASMVKVVARELESSEEVVGFGSYSKAIHHGFSSHCKEVYLVDQAERREWHALPREKYPKPLVFHDGRLAFRPTPASTLVMFVWLPVGILLGLFRVMLYILLPYDVALPIGAFTGMKSRLILSATQQEITQHGSKSHLYVCNHRTLLDPIYVAAGLNKRVTAVTYSLSRISELISPIKTMRLTRNKEEDRVMMEKLLSQGDLVVCPEGTTCREPYLLRFSPLFAELTEEVIPVALVTRVGMFYGTTASGYKCFDPLFFLMNPRPEYDIQFLEKVATDWAGNKNYSSCEVANQIQRMVGDALGYECTALTRKDKYLMLADNEGIVKQEVKR